MTELQILQQLKRKYDAEMVSALIGAGFTLNAYPKAQMWSGMLKDLVAYAYADELDALYQEYVHRRFSVDVKSFDDMKDELIQKIIDRDGYLNVVSEYIQKKGYREAIDYYIETHNPYFYKRDDGKFGVAGDDETVLTDKDFSVHQRFLTGKWQYVFTTNFDNALEFVNDRFDMGYVPIYSDYEMSRRKMARPIVKIHGSLVSSDETLKKPFAFDGDYSRRYIISKEDFDTYFERHEAFSYLLRVAMLSGTYLLLGFSGDDPNFKSWLEWVKDILDKDLRDNLSNADNSTGEVLVKEDEDNIKVFLVLVGNGDIPTEQQLYYRNHHIGVIHLGNKDIMRELMCFDNTPTPIRIDHLLKYIIGEEYQTDASDELKGTSVPKDTLTKKWDEFYDLLHNGKDVTDVLAEIRVRRENERFLKWFSTHEVILNEIEKRQKNLSDTDKEITNFLVEDMGLFRSQMGTTIGSQMEDNPEWLRLGVHEDTLVGMQDVLDGGDDYIVLENVLRSLYHFDFTDARRRLQEWKPEGNFKAVKASLNYYYDRDDSLRLLDSLRMNTRSDVEKYVTSFLYNCLDSNFYPYYPLNEYRNKGLVGLNDTILSIVEQLKSKKPDLAAYGTEETIIHMDGEDAALAKEREHAQRFLQVISKEGFNLCYGISNVVNIADWYMVFRRIYTSLPYPCMYYSCQYNNRKVLRRIGQDFAFELALQDVLPHLLHQIFTALSCPDTPHVLKYGMLQIGGQMFFGMKEDVWFEDFETYLRNTFVVEGDDYFHSSDAKNFVWSAMVCLYTPEHIGTVLSVMLDYCEKDADKSINMIMHCLRLNKLQTLTDNLATQLEKLASELSVSDAAALLNVIKQNGLLSDDLCRSFLRTYTAQLDELRKSDRYGLYNFCKLAEDDAEAVKALQPIILERNIWDSGADNGRYSEPGQFWIMSLGDTFQWADEEQKIIYDNLKINLAALNNKLLKDNTLFSDSYVALLTDMMTFADKYPVVEVDVKNRIQEKLNIAKHYDCIEQGLYSERPDDIEKACRELNQSFRAGKFRENRKYFDILINKTTMKNAPGITECLVSVSVAIHFCGEQIKELADAQECTEYLYRLLLQYKGKDLRDLDLQIIHAGHALMEIATFLQNMGCVDDNIKWWTENENLNRFNFMEY